MTETLTTTDHNRNVAGLTYVYPVISRRAGGLSIGVNFNINNACNWRCVYCQVPNLATGSAPDMDFALLEKELRFFLNDVLHGDFYDRFNMAAEHRAIKDIAISGNGEPTSLKQLAEAIELIGRIATELGILPSSKFVLISNGSLVHLPKVQEGLKTLAHYGGEVWFKIDSATQEGRQRINHCSISWQHSLRNLTLSASLCLTKVQTCLFRYADIGFSDAEQAALLTLFQTIKEQTPVNSVMLYSIARESFQPEAPQLTKLSLAELNGFAEKLKALGFEVSVTI